MAWPKDTANLQQPDREELGENNLSHACIPFILFFFFFVFFVFQGPYLWHMEIPRPGGKLDLQMLAYATAIAMLVPSRVSDLHHSSWQRWIVNPLSKARDQTRVLMDTI